MYPQNFNIQERLNLSLSPRSIPERKHTGPTFTKGNVYLKKKTKSIDNTKKEK